MNVTLNKMQIGNKANHLKNDNKLNQNSESKSSPVKILMKQKEELQKQIKELQKKSSEDKLRSDETGIKIMGQKDPNSDAIKELQKQISDIDGQIAKLESDAINNKIQGDKKEKHDSEENAEHTLEKKIIGFSSNINTMNIQNSVKKKLKDSSGVLEIEIKIDKSRGVDTTKKEKELANIKHNIEKLDATIIKELKHVKKNSSVNKTHKTENNKDAKAVKAEENKNKSIEENTDLKGNLVDVKA